MKKETQMYLAILEEAKRLSGEKGYNGWSYQDISETIKITKASIHHHFPKKQDLGCALVRHHHDLIRTHLKDIDSQWSHPQDKLQALADLYSQIVEKANSACPCGMLLADLATLPEVLQGKIKDFFADHQAWVEKVIEASVKDKQYIKREAFLIVSFLQGALLMARLHPNPSAYFKMAAYQFLEQKFR